jgi:hypothetical protein
MFTPCLISTSILFYKRGTQKKYGKMVENLEGEIWKPVVGYEGKYEVSNMGRVKSLNFARKGEEGIMKPNFTIKKNGYLFVNLRKNGKTKGRLIHRLVYDAFCGNLPKFVVTQKGDERMELNHINEIKTDNRVENLELITCRQNNNHGTHNERSGFNRRHKVYQYTTDYQLIRIWTCVKECGENGFNSDSIYKACENNYGTLKKNVHKGFIWSYHPVNGKSKDV